MKKLLLFSFLFLTSTVCAMEGDTESVLQEGDIGTTLFLSLGGGDGEPLEGVNPFPLHTAVSEGNMPRARRLIKAGWQIDELDNIRLTPLMQAVWMGWTGNADMVRFLLENGASVNKTNGYATALYCGVKPGGSRNVARHLNAVKSLLKAGATINQKHQMGRTALCEAVSELPYCFDRQLQLDTIRLLLEKGADPSIKDDSGEDSIEKAKEESLKSMILSKRGHYLEKQQPKSQLDLAVKE